MSRQRVVNYYNDRYKGSLTDSQCDILESIIELDKNNGCLSNLLHVIYNLPDSTVNQIIDEYDVYGSLVSKGIEKPIGTLREDQTLGVGYMYYANNCILGDSVGMGKTVEVAGLCNLLKQEALNKGQDFKYLFLTEKSLTTQVRKEMIKFTGDYVNLLPSGESKAVANFVETEKCYGVTNSLVGSHSLLNQSIFIGWLKQMYDNKQFPYDLLIVDESSVLGSSTTKIVKAFKMISPFFKRIIFLNATPFETKLNIFFTQLGLLDTKLLPTKQNFTKEYVIMDYTGMYPRATNKYKNQAQFKRLIGYRYFARTRMSKGAEMKNCKGGVLVSPLSKVQKEWLKKTSLNRLVYDCPSYLDPSIEYNMENVPKLASLAKLLDDFKDADTILIFSHYKEPQKYLQQWLENRGYSCRILNGDVIKERDSIIESFKRAEFQILITNVQKGLNFGNCDHCIFYSYDPNPSKMIQFEGRITRDFDILNKNVYILCSKGAEYNTLVKAIRDRAKATVDFTNTDISVVMNILLGNSVDEVGVEDDNT